MGKIVTATLSFGATMEFSRLLPVWLSNGWKFTQETPPFFREVYETGAGIEREFDHEPSDAKTLNEFLRELDEIYASGKNTVVNLEHGELFAYVAWQHDTPAGMNECEFTLVGSSIRIADGVSTYGHTNWNHVFSLIAQPLYNNGIFIECLTLYEDF